MRKNRLLRLVLAATFLGAVSALSFLPQVDPVPQVDWVNVDETNPVFPPESPDTGQDGTGDGGGSDPDGDGESGGSTPEGGGDPGESGVDQNGTDGEGGAAGSGGGGGLLGLSFPVQAGMSVGVLALAFLALLPGRRMPASLR